MLNLDEAKRILHGPTLVNRDQLLVLLAIQPVVPLPVHEIKVRCAAAGLPKLAKKNISNVLATANGSVARTIDGWELQQPGIIRVRELAQTVDVNLVVTHSSRSQIGRAHV